MTFEVYELISYLRSSGLNVSALLRTLVPYLNGLLIFLLSYSFHVVARIDLLILVCSAHLIVRNILEKLWFLFVLTLYIC